MITANNYVAECERDMINLRDRFKKLNLKTEEAVLSSLLLGLKNAVKFVVPDGGKILNDKFKGLEGNSFRLPYQAITVEYFMPEDEEDLTEETPNHSPKRICLAVEVERNLLIESLEGSTSPESYTEKLLKTLNIISGNFAVVKYVFCFSKGQWHVMPMGWITPSEWQQKDPYLNSPKIEPLGKSTQQQVLVGGCPVPVISKAFNSVIAQYGWQKGLSYMHNDIGHEIAAVFELCEALSCSNVVHEPVKKVSNSLLRKKCGLLPEYETRVLRINVPSKHTKEYSQGSNHQSPREHLRRGHIRRLEKGDNIWVNSCIVGSKTQGVIDKTYRVNNTSGKLI